MVGSSKIIKSGLFIIALDMSRRRLIPPESSETLARRFSVNSMNSSNSLARSLATPDGILKNLAYTVRFSSTGNSSSKFASWGTTPKRCLILRPEVLVSSPKTFSEPEVDGDTHPIIRIVVVLPAPLGPRKPKHSLVLTSKSIPRTASVVSKAFLNPHASTIEISEVTFRPFFQVNVMVNDLNLS